jgi:predicted RNA-binding Zn ribbon-like protein
MVVTQARMFVMNEKALMTLVEGKPAPMPLLAVQAFANTLDVEDGTDRLESLESFQAWLEEMEMVEPGVKMKPDNLRDARGVREALRILLTANTEGRVDKRALELLAAHRSWRQVNLTMDGSGGLGLDLGPAESAYDLPAQLLGIAFQAQVDGTWERLKLCQNPECEWAFYDSSKNRSGSWCRMGQCGNRLKNRAYRQRRGGATSS